MQQTFLQALLPENFPRYSCELCRRYEINADGKPVELNGQPVARAVQPNCELCQKRRYGLEDFNAMNRDTWRCYNELLACGPTPEQAQDERFRENMGLCKTWERICAQLAQDVYAGLKRIRQHAT